MHFKQAGVQFGAALLQWRIAGQADRLAGQAAPALVELAITVNVLEQLQCVSPGRQVGKLQAWLRAAGLRHRCCLPALRAWRMQGCIKSAIGTGIADHHLQAGGMGGKKGKQPAKLAYNSDSF